jgi:hypothetical protein
MVDDGFRASLASLTAGLPNNGEIQPQVKRYDTFGNSSGSTRHMSNPDFGYAMLHLASGSASPLEF